jgi:hypothetical protein
MRSKRKTLNAKHLKGVTITNYLFSFGWLTISPRLT